MASLNAANGKTSPSLSSGPHKAQLKTTTTAKAMDGTRKQSASPIDASQRKAPAPKAWTSGTNPITQRSSNSPLPNGAVGAAKGPAGAKAMATSKESTQSDNNQHAHDRMVYLISNFIGYEANVTLKNGERFTGIFSAPSLEQQEHRYVLKMTKKLPSSSGQTNGAAEPHSEYCGAGPEHKMAFDVKDVVLLNADGVSTDKAQAKPRNGESGRGATEASNADSFLGASAGFRTDADISGNLQMRERDLQPWVPSADTDVDLSLDDSGTGWDQFEANERLFGATSNYDEELYTTKINRDDPTYKQKAAQAEKLAREIESGVAMNAHVAEERGAVAPDDSGLNEEDKYSGVRRDFQQLSSGQANKYTPPARRAPTSQPTVPGAPVDPAIISSQLARSNSPAANPSPTPVGDSNAQQTTSAKEDENKPTAAPVATSSSTSRPGDSTATNAESTRKTPSLQQTTSDMAAGRRTGKTVENDLVDAFKQFSANEKMRLQERQRHAARHDKNVKLNDLKKFAANFNYSAPIPEDLIPILAKDPSKQQEIKQKSQKAAEERKSAPTPERKPAAPAADVKTQPKAPGAPAASQVDRLNQRGRPAPGAFPQAPRSDRNFQNNGGMPFRNGPGNLSQRLAITQQQHRSGMGMPNMPHAVPINDMRGPPTGPTAPSSGSHTPTSSISTRFNVKAMEFRPNPAANTFTPGGNTSNSSSPRKESVPARPEPRRAPTSSFFGNQKPAPPSERPSLTDMFNPIKRLKKEAQSENKTKEYTINGGIPQAYRTPPTWDVPEKNVEKSYADMFERAPITVQPMSAPQAINNGPIPHQHQLPPHLQQGGHAMGPVHTPQHTPRHPPVQPHHGPSGPHFDGHHMQFSASNSGVHPSPRAGMPPFVAYNQVPQHMPQFSQGMPAFGMGPNVQAVPIRQPGFVTQSPAMGGQMMVNQPSNGGPVIYGNPPGMQPMPQMPGMVYSPAPGQAFPHHGGPMPGPAMGANGFPSPRPPVAQMMSHQGSQQGHPPQQFMPMPNGAYPVYHQAPQGSMTPMRGPYPQPHQAHYGSSPHQHHHFPQQHRGTPSGSYSQPMMPAHSMPPQMPPAGPGQHVADGGEKVE
ncbi:PAB1 binding protein-like protein [Phyllosticta citricarpa]|uniref:PAB1 binding protein-like protein n=2 Tax=Phyllosticta TaxID=121621 RepID=A0ABR1MPS0_9PEZI